MHSGTHGSAKVGFQCVALQFVGRCHTTLQLWMGVFCLSCDHRARRHPVAMIRL